MTRKKDRELTAEQVEQVLGVSRVRACYLAREGIIEARKLLSQCGTEFWLFTEKSVMEYKKTRKVGRPKRNF